MEDVGNVLPHVSWETDPIDHKWLENKLFPSGSEAPIVSRATRGYSHFGISQPSSEAQQAVGYQQEVRNAAKRNDSDAVRKYLTDPRIGGLLAGEFKIHIQPERRFMPLVALKLAKILQDPSIRILVDEFKVSTEPGGVDDAGQEMPQIVIYPAFGRDNARRLLEILRKSLSQEEKYGTGKLSRYNLRVNDLLSLAQSGGDFKTDLAQAGLLDEYFDKNTGYAFIKGEVANWQDLVPPANQAPEELPPQQALDRARLLLRTAQSQKSGRSVRWREEDLEVSKTIQARMAGGETIDAIIAKAAANVRGLRTKYNLE